MSGRILVVDDIATNRVILRAKLAAAYYDVLQAENGREALAKARDEQPDLILLDIVMPDLDGFTVCRRLKADPATAHIPVVIVTALNDPFDRLKGLECGADDFLSKPINDLALFSRLRNLLRAKFMFDELTLRDSTTEALGLGGILDQRGPVPPMPARVMLVPPNHRSGGRWMAALEGRDDIAAVFAKTEDAILNPDDSEIPDVYIVHANLPVYGDGLRLVSHLRTRPRTRQTALILVVPEGDQNRAAKGLDLGASDYIFDPFDTSELLVRLKSQIRRKRLSDRLRANVTDSLRLAVTDPLTGLYNRRYAQQHLGRIADRAKETGKCFTLMILDLDRFKSVNDRFGHDAGDAVLKEFARRVQENLRAVDLVSRIGGEEFLVAMPDTTPDQARIASERLRRIIEATPMASGPNGVPIQVTVSVGVSMGRDGATDVDSQFREADQALYASKAEGRNLVTIYTPAA
jgi:two-component system cell cycle response regulator